MTSGAHPVYTARAISAYKCGMYQSVDDIHPDEQPDPSERPVWLWLIGLAIAAALVAAAILNNGGFSGATGQVDPLSPEPEARKAYLRALAEPQPALRRARLTDFLNHHSQNPRAGAVLAQLEVLDAAADQDWLATLTTAYDPRVEIDVRRQAVRDYRQEWGRYLGGRDDDIDALLAEIDALEGEDVPPDRTLARNPDTYAGIPDDQLAGGPYGSRRRNREYDRRSRVTYRPTRPRSEPGDASGDVIAPSVLWNVSPRYPRRAMRRNVEAVVILSLDIDERGRVEEIELVNVQAARYANDFVRSAERAALRTRFNPKTVGGVPVEARSVRKRYRFELSD